MFVTPQANFKITARKYILYIYHDRNAGGSYVCIFCTFFQQASMLCELQGPLILLVEPTLCTKSALPPNPAVDIVLAFTIIADGIQTWRTKFRM